MACREILSVLTVAVAYFYTDIYVYHRVYVLCLEKMYFKNNSFLSNTLLGCSVYIRAPIPSRIRCDEVEYGSVLLREFSLGLMRVK